MHLPRYWSKKHMLHQRTQTYGVVSLYCWPPVYFFGFICFAYVELATNSFIWLNPNQSNWRSAVQWYFPLWWVFSGYTFIRTLFSDLVSLGPSHPPAWSGLRPLVDTHAMKKIYLNNCTHILFGSKRWYKRNCFSSIGDPG